MKLLCKEIKIYYYLYFSVKKKHLLMDLRLQLSEYFIYPNNFCHYVQILNIKFFMTTSYQHFKTNN